MTFARSLVGVTLALLSAVTAYAQQQTRIPIRKVTTLAGSDSGVLANVYVLHAQSDGSVLVNDATRSRLLLFDATLKKYKLVADTAGESANNFGIGAGGLLLFAGDSTAFVDRASKALVIVDAKGNFGRVTTPPRVDDTGGFSGSTYGVPGFDAQGRLYYRGGLQVFTLPVLPAHDTTLVFADSAPVVRADFDARRVDTIGVMHIPLQKSKVRPVQNRFTFVQIINPLPVTDEWAYLADGTVAIVRGQDYHIDWFLPDGSRRSTPKMPFDWRRLTDADKQRMVDSVQHMLDSAYDAALARFMESNAPQGRGGPQPTFQKGEVVKAAELPDYYPPVRASSQMRADLDGNLWILPTTSLQASGGSLLDVVNRQGEIIERVQLPEGRNLHGFGAGGIIYMSVPVQYSWPRIEKARIER